MVEAKVSAEVIKELLEIARHAVKLPMRSVWLDYDAEADVLYVSLRRPQQATQSRLLDDGVILRFRGKELVGVTILDASRRRRR